MIKKLIFAGACAVICFGNAHCLASFERGDSGNDVTLIQERLAELHYTISIDGEFGPAMEAIVKQFQEDFGLDNDGIIGPATYRTLMRRELPSHNVARRVINAGYSVLGTPFVFGGTSSRYGFDCSGFTQYAFHQAGVDIPRMADAQYYAGQRIASSNLRAGDLVFFTTYEPGPSHCGIYLGNGRMLHCGSSTGVTVAAALTGYWGDHYYGACRII